MTSAVACKVCPPRSLAMQRLAIRRSSSCSNRISWLRAASSPSPHAKSSPVTRCVGLRMPQPYTFSRRVPVLASVFRLCRRGGKHGGKYNRRSGGSSNSDGCGDADRRRSEPAMLAEFHPGAGGHDRIASVGLASPFPTCGYLVVSTRILNVATFHSGTDLEPLVTAAARGDA